MAHSDSKRTDRARERSIARRQARTCKHHVPERMSKSGRERVQASR